MPAKNSNNFKFVRLPHFCSSGISVRYAANLNLCDLVSLQLHYDDEDDSRNPFNISNDEYYYPKNLGENKLKANLAGSLQVSYCISSIPSKAVCHEIGPEPWKIGSKDFVERREKDAFSS